MGAALAGAGAVVYGIESRQLDENVASKAQRELDDFADFQRSGTNPADGQPWNGLGPMFKSYLTGNVPTDCDLYIGWVGDSPKYTSTGADLGRGEADRLTHDPAFLAAADQAIASGRPTPASTPGYGELVINAQPVRQGDTTGALVIVSYLEMEHRELMQTMQTYVLVALLALMFITGVAAWQSGRLLAPLRTLRRTADDITETDLSRRIPVRGNDDITQLTHTLNGMLGRLEAAFVGQRTFLDDAGHELRTPLTVLRGHLEVLDADSPEDVAETRELLLDEVDRMSRLVGDLILLTKSGRPDFLATGEVELGPLTETLLAKARGMADRRWTLDGTGAGSVTVDEQRITQAVLQLADNAVKHTSSGDVVAVGSSYDEDAARVWVRDTGSGVPEGQRAHIFDRFGRGEAGEDDEGFGLGLSIVRAIAEAHGGTVHVEDAEPHGSRFVITLPRDTTWPAS